MRAIAAIVGLALILLTLVPAQTAAASTYRVYSAKLSKYDFYKIFVLPPDATFRVEADVDWDSAGPKVIRCGPSDEFTLPTHPYPSGIDWLGNSTGWLGDAEEIQGFEELVDELSEKWPEDVRCFVVNYRGAKILYVWTNPFGVAIPVDVKVYIAYSPDRRGEISGPTARVLEGVVENPGDVAAFYEIRDRPYRYLVISQREHWKEAYRLYAKIAAAGGIPRVIFIDKPYATDVYRIVRNTFDEWEFDVLLLHGDTSEIRSYAVVLSDPIWKNRTDVASDILYAMYDGAAIPQFVVSRVPLHGEEFDEFISHLGIHVDAAPKPLIVITGWVFPPAESGTDVLFSRFDGLQLPREDAVVLGQWFEVQYIDSILYGTLVETADNYTWGHMNRVLPANFSTLMILAHGSNDRILKVEDVEGSPIWGYEIRGLTYFNRTEVSGIPFHVRRAILFSCETFPPWGVDLIRRGRADVAVGFVKPVAVHFETVMLRYVRDATYGDDDVVALMRAYLMMSRKYSVYHRLIMLAVGVPLPAPIKRVEKPYVAAAGGYDVQFAMNVAHNVTAVAMGLNWPGVEAFRVLERGRFTLIYDPSTVSPEKLEELASYAEVGLEAGISDGYLPPAEFQRIYVVLWNWHDGGSIIAMHVGNFETKAGTLPVIVVDTGKPLDRWVLLYEAIHAYTHQHRKGTGYEGRNETLDIAIAYAIASKLDPGYARHIRENYAAIWDEVEELVVRLRAGGWDAIDPNG